MTIAMAERAAIPAALPRFYYGWVNVVIASIAMTATLPGRTHGLGLIAKKLTDDPSLGVGELLFGTLNFWAVIVGSALCLPTGRLIDRFGVRGVMAVVSAGLGLAVIGMSRATGVIALFAMLTLVRGLGQGALSVASMAAVGKWFTKRLPVAMGIYAVLLALAFIPAWAGAGFAVTAFGWRDGWAAVGLALLLGMAPLAAIFLRSTPESMGLPVERTSPMSAPRAALDLPAGRALRLPAFWTFTLAAACFNFVWSAITLFNETLLAELHFDTGTYQLAMGLLVLSGLPTNLLVGWLAQRRPMGRILAVGMMLLAAALAAFPLLRTTTHVILYSLTMGVCGGIVTVVWFAAYGHAFGRGHLGIIQAVAQVASVLASALGPLLLATCRDWLGSSRPFFFASAAVATVAGIAVWWTPLPSSEGVT